MKVPSGMYLIW